MIWQESGQLLFKEKKFREEIKPLIKNEEHLIFSEIQSLYHQKRTKFFIIIQENSFYNNLFSLSKKSIIYNPKSKF